jgi:glycosyltransferase involved in cell wall biosynthesis
LTRTALVIPWFGADLVGGSEQHIFQVATRLAKRGHRVEVLTTCCRSFADDWGKNHYREGTSDVSGILVRRFPVRQRDEAAFAIANRELVDLNERAKLAGVCPASERTARVFVKENIHSPQLLEYLDRESAAYRNVVFAPYLYGPTLLGVERLRGRAVLQPMLHDETYAYLPQVAAVFHLARRILFNSDGEWLLARRLYGPSIVRKGFLTGEGVETEARDPSSEEEEGRVARVAPAPFLLYLGRRDATKNTHLLVGAFKRFRASRPESLLQLVLAGQGALTPADAASPGVVDLGVVRDPEKAWLLSHCRALAQPSRNESYSRTVMEAWLHGAPVVVHRECLATRLPVESSRGGWAIDSEEEWASVFREIDSAPDAKLRTIGERGRAYAQVYADWDAAIDRYEEALDLRAQGSPRRSRRAPGGRAIHQLLPNLDYGDAISNQAAFIRELLCEMGFRSEIFVQHIDERMSALGKPFEPGAIRRNDAVIYHHSIGSALTANALRHPGPKALVYHNITPPSFFEPWDQSFAKLLETGRRDLARLASSFPVSCGDSAYNAKELRELGFSDPRVLPIFVDPLRWAQPADPDWMRTLQDGRTNLLFVGRIVPNKCQHHLLHAFREFRSFDPDARLILVGGWQDGHPYAVYLRELAHELGVSASVLFARSCTDAQLLACYRTAHLFWSMSEHEGFCVPLVEAMWFDVPVLAYRSSAIPETLGTAGMMFTEKKWPEIAALAHLLVEDAGLRRKVVEAQARRRVDFLPEKVLPRFIELVEALTGEPSSVRAVS